MSGRTTHGVLKHQRGPNGISNKEVAVRYGDDDVVLCIHTENQRNTSAVQTVVLNRGNAVLLSQWLTEASVLAAPPPSKADRIRQLLRDYGGGTSIPVHDFEAKYGSIHLNDAIESILNEEGDL